jgi:hypothetical protein
MLYDYEPHKNATNDEIAAFAKALADARSQATTLKNEESDWFARPPLQELTKDWFFEHYSKPGQRIGASRMFAAIRDILSRTYTVALGTSGWTVRCNNRTICTMYLIKIDQIQPATEGNFDNNPERRSYYSLGQGEDVKTYVLDDAGTLTRRYAYCGRPPHSDDEHRPKVKSLDQFVKQYAIRFDNDETLWRDAMENAWDAIHPGGPDTWCNLSREAKVCLAYLNYANNGTLGVCLSSTFKRIRSNTGVAFIKQEGDSLWTVDLSMIPKSSVLINIYARNPEKEGWLDTRNRSLKGGWIAAGTVKNRELFCSLVPQVAAREGKVTPRMLMNDNWRLEGDALEDDMND